MSKCILTPDQAIAMLNPTAESIHTFRNPGAGMLIGADWNRADLLDAIHKAEKVELGGEQSQSLNHGLVVWTGTNPLYVECREGLDYAAVEAATKTEATA